MSVDGLEVYPLCRAPASTYYTCVPFYAITYKLVDLQFLLVLSQRSVHALIVGYCLARATHLPPSGATRIPSITQAALLCGSGSM